MSNQGFRISIFMVMLMLMVPLSTLITEGSHKTALEEESTANLSSTSSSTSVEVDVYRKDIEWKSISSVPYGYGHWCGVSIDNFAYCWGGGNIAYGQIGTGYIPTESIQLPYLVQNMPNNASVSNISTGQYHTCALLTDDNVSCWGRAKQGTLGVNLSNYDINYPSPQAILDFGNGRKAVQIESGSSASCALLDDGNVSCWGDNTYGVIGSGTVDNKYYTPQQVDLLAAIKSCKNSDGYLSCMCDT